MSIVSTLIDKAKEGSGIDSDSALAAHFGVHRQAVSKWRNDDAFPDEHHIVTMAEMAREDPGQWLVAIKAVRSEGTAAKHWAGVARRLAASAAIVLCAIGMAGNALPAKASGYAAHCLHIMFSGWWIHLARLWLGRRGKPQGPYIEARL